ncbi:MAG TPA: efflux RND transporter periplasmic adaptor subunit [Candidatus Omnitrophica bacterium]|nr:efflux RND transporter periplasmic adaptor subunit [Candidatus Omnitrophota bacterium]
MRKIIFVLFVIMALSGIAFSGNFLVIAKAEKSPSFETATVKKKDIGSSILATGTVRPVIGAEVKVGARISGKVEHLYANIGDRVEKGQVIAEIEKKDLEAQVAQAEANVRAADAGVGVSKASFWPALSAQTDYGVKGTTYFPSQGDNFAGLKVTMPLFNGQDLYTIKQSKAVKEATKAALEFSKIQLSYATIKAPISGVIASVTTQEGETVAAGLSAPTFVTIIDLSRLQVDAFVDETDIGRVKVGQKAIFTVDTYPDKEFTGKVKAIYPKAIIQENVVNFDVVIEIDGSNEELLRPDMTTSVTIYQEERGGVLVIPRSAVIREGAGKFVLVKQDNGSFGKREVKTGMTSGSDIEVVSGLDEGDIVGIRQE